MNILFFANLVPFPLDGGGKIFTHSVLTALSSNNNVDLVCFYEHEDIQQAEKELKPFCRSITFLPIKVTTRENMKLMMIKAVESLLSDKPLGVKKYITTEMIEVIKDKMSSTRYDCAFFNLLAMYAYAPIVNKLDSRVKTVLYEQNCEALIYERYFKETNNLLKKAFLLLETAKLQRFEQKAIHSVDQLILLSKEDQNALKVNNREVNIIPIGVRPTEVQKDYQIVKDNQKVTMLFVGTMTWAPNNEGIIWFLENVMPMCSDGEKYELYVIGKNPSDTVQQLTKQYANVHILGYVDSLDEYYEKCDVLIVPLFIGSGQRVKIIEAFARGYAVISTSIGAEGLKYKDDVSIMIADTKEEFLNKIDACRDRDLLRSIGENGKHVFDQEYSTDVIKKKLNAVLEK